DTTATPTAPGRTDVEIADRLNLDVRMGHPVALRRDSPDFVAAHAGLFALGGNFSSRLMQTVRDEQGLTYGIGSALHNVSVEHDGHALVYASLSQDRLEEGLAATRAVIERFVQVGVNEEELERVRTTLAGTHAVALATTSGLAARLLVNAERGFDIGYLDHYPEMVRALTVDEVNRAVRTHLRPDELHVAVAGTLPAAPSGGA
ncbi:MAG TPA: insulinase family protein, partial [Rhodothermales bacterium]|nr:insulinase family protein [Rhodothermales bacterium]